MAYTKLIVCLANSNSTQTGDRGTETAAGNWIRSVSPRPTHEISL